jgi:hypothetical protein
VLPASGYALVRPATTATTPRPLPPVPKPTPPRVVPRPPAIGLNPACDPAAQTLSVEALGRNFDPRLSVTVFFNLHYEMTTQPAPGDPGFLTVIPQQWATRTMVVATPHPGTWSQTYTAPAVDPRYAGAFGFRQVVYARAVQNNGTDLSASYRCVFR